MKILTVSIILMVFFVSWASAMSSCGCPFVPAPVCVLVKDNLCTMLNSCLAECLGTTYPGVIMYLPTVCPNANYKISDTVDPACSRNCRRCKMKENVALVASSSQSLSEENIILGSQESLDTEEVAEAQRRMRKVVAPSSVNRDEERLFLNAEQEGLCIEDEFTVCGFNGKTYSSACLLKCHMGMPAILHWGACRDHYAL